MVPALVEGHLDGQVLRSLWRQLGRPEQALVVKDSRGQFWKMADKYNQAGRMQHVVGLVDLEDAACPAQLIGRLRAPKSPGFFLRVSVRMIESWIMADRVQFAGFLGVPSARLPVAVDEIGHPKRLVVDLARRSRRREVREGLVPSGSGALVGPEYTRLMAQFVSTRWSLARARQLSPSLARAAARLAQVQV